MLYRISLRVKCGCYRGSVNAMFPRCSHGRAHVNHYAVFLSVVLQCRVTSVHAADFLLRSSQNVCHIISTFLRATPVQEDARCVF